MRILIFFLCMIIFSACATTQHKPTPVETKRTTAPSHGKAPTPRGITQAASVSSTSAGMFVSLTGHMTEHFYKGIYRFQDDTASITVELSDKIAPDTPISPERAVRITGRVMKSDKAKVRANTLEFLD